MKYNLSISFEIHKVTNNSINANCQNKDLSYYFYSKNCSELHADANNIDECYLKALVIKANSYWCNNGTNKNVFNCHLHDNDFHSPDLRINVCVQNLNFLGYMDRINVTGTRSNKYIKQSKNGLYNHIILSKYVHGFDFTNYENKVHFESSRLRESKFHWSTFAHEIGHFFNLNHDHYSSEKKSIMYNFGASIIKNTNMLTLDYDFVLKCFGKREKKMEILAPFFDLTVTECLKRQSYNIKRLQIRKKNKIKT